MSLRAGEGEGCVWGGLNYLVVLRLGVTGQRGQDLRQPEADRVAVERRVVGQEHQAPRLRLHAVAPQQDQVPQPTRALAQPGRVRLKLALWSPQPTEVRPPTLLRLGR
jgi:hypothetical protein